jgi:hypothetical protein
MKGTNQKFLDMPTLRLLMTKNFSSSKKLILILIQNIMKIQKLQMTVQEVEHNLIKIKKKFLNADFAGLLIQKKIIL